MFEEIKEPLPGVPGATRSAANSARESEEIRPGIPRMDTTQSVAQKKALEGYPKLARFVGEKPGTAIFRRFAALNARNLLYKQVELLELEQQLDMVEEENSQSPETRAFQFEMLLLKAQPEGSPGWVQLDLMRQLDEKLKNYNELLLQHYQLYKLPRPHYDQVSNLERFIHDKTAHGDHGGLSFLHYPEGVVWETLDKELVQKDLVSLSGHEEPVGPDPFTRLIRWSVLKRFHRLFGQWRQPDEEFGVYEYSGKSIERIAFNIAIVTASLLPTGSIFALYFIPTTVWRLAFIAFWSLFFSSALAFFTNASSIEVFTASVALASVQVVFVGTTSGY